MECDIRPTQMQPVARGCVSPCRLTVSENAAYASDAGKRGNDSRLTASKEPIGCGEKNKART